MKRYFKQLTDTGWALVLSIRNVWDMRSIWIVHAIPWTTLSLIVWIVTWIKHPEQSLWPVPLPILLYAACWYSFFFLTEVTWDRRWWYKITIITLCALLFIPLAFVYLHRFMPWIGLSLTAKRQQFDWEFVGRMYTQLQFVILSAYMLVFLLRYRKSDRKLAKTREDLDQLYNTRSELEYQTSVSEVFPHFAFNMMNSIYADLRETSKSLSMLMATTSELLLYCLSTKTRTVVVNREIDQLKKFIAMQDRRFDGKAYVKLTIEGQACGQRVVPMSMILLVKNAYKHGDLSDPDHPLQITVRLGQDAISFECRNKIRAGDEKQITLGSGLENLRKRLDFVFGDHASLTCHNNGTYYRCELIIKEKRYVRK